MQLDPRKFTETRHSDVFGDDMDDVERHDRITFFRSRMDGEWYVEFGHRTAGAVSYMSAIYKVNDDLPLDELHEASEMVTVFNDGTWSDS